MYSLEVKNLTRVFRIGGMILGTKLTAVDDISFKVEQDSPWIMSIVGESGSGKTTLARMLLGLQEPSSGEMLINGQSLDSLLKNKRDFYTKVQPIFQNPFTAFSSRRMVISYLYETALHLKIAPNRDAAEQIIKEVLHTVGIEINYVKDKFPNQFSGGELQRICVARALITKPQFIVADEPVSMIDASLRMNIVNLFKDLKTNFNVCFIYITHDLSTANYVSDYVAAMYRGNLIEFGKAQDIMKNPSHPYTELLMESIPRVGKRWDDDMVLPDFESKEYSAVGCKFATRCRYAKDICHQMPSPMVDISNTHSALCFRHCGYQAQ